MGPLMWLAIGIGGVVAYVAGAGIAYRFVGGWGDYWTLYDDERGWYGEGGEWKPFAIVLWPVVLPTLVATVAALGAAWFLVGVPLRATFRLTSGQIRLSTPTHGSAT